MSGSGREAPTDVRDGREALHNVWEWLGRPTGCLGVVQRYSRMSGSGREASRMSGSGRESLPNVRECSDTLRYVRQWLGVPPG